MTRPEHFTAEQVRRGVSHLLGGEVEGNPVRTEHGFGNENWIVRVDGRDILIKITPQSGHTVDKLAAASTAHRLAEQAGIPVPAEVFFSESCDVFEGSVTRIQEFVVGLHPSVVLTTERTVATFFTSLGGLLARLHSIRLDAFASRVGGEPSFDSWAEYLEHRVPQIRERARAVQAYDDAFLVTVVETLRRVATDVSPVVDPRLCHRDVFFDNVLANDSGEIVALLDFDLAEPWDPAVDLVKPQWLMFGEFEGAEACFLDGYLDGGEAPPRWAERVWLASVLELLNVVPNALLAGDHRFAAAGRHRLDQVLSARPSR